MKRNSLAVSLATLLVVTGGCSRSPTSPSDPPSNPPSPPPATFTLSGVISESTETGLIPVKGVLVQEAVSRQAGQAVSTDQNGFYTLTGLPARNTIISVSKWGYDAFTREVTISADTRLDLNIVRITTYTISGIVFEVTPTGQVPIEGVSLYCDSCGSPDGHTFVDSDANGSYSFSWAHNGATFLMVKKEGYLALPSGGVTVMVRGDTRFDIELVRQ